jgi:DNA-binding transcriptional ArsR family regulator
VKYVVIAPVAASLEKVMKALFELEVKEAVLVYHKSNEQLAEEVSKELKKKHIPSTLKEMRGNMWEDAFKVVSETRKLAGENNVIVNVGTSESLCKCVLMSAAFVNGLKTVDILLNGEKVMLPIMKFSYYKLLSPKKMELLKLLHGSDCCTSLEELSKRTKMSLPLVSYHVNGNLKSEGLKELGLVDTKSMAGKTSIKLSFLGKLLVQGLVDQAEE